MKTRASDVGGSHRSTGRASSAWMRTLVSPPLLDGRQRLDDAFLERLAADDADV